MSYIVLDMEWNMAKSKKQMVNWPVKLYGEIIQIGAVKLNDRLEVIDSFDSYIKPKYYTSINKEVEKITLISDKDLEHAEPFQAVIERFKSWCGEDDIILTWGDDDIPMLEDNLRLHEIDTEWIPESFDAQWMFDDQVTMENRRYSLDYARYKFGIKGKAAHNALNDASNTAEVIQHLNVAEWIAEERMYLAEECNSCDLFVKVV